VGGHLAEHLVALGDTVSGCSRSGRWPDGLQHLSQRIRLSACDLADASATRDLFERGAFDVVFHLAGLANPRACCDDPAMAHRQNVMSSENLYDAIHRSGQKPTVLFVSTAYVYGQPASDELPVRATAPVRADHPYAATKWKAEQISMRYAVDYGLAIRRVRPFNHVGPRQPAGYIVSDWARQVAAIEAGRARPLLRVGNLDTRRDYTDVRDVVRAYRMLACQPGTLTPAACDVYNLGSGTSRSGREILDRLRALSRTAWHWEMDEQLVRSGEASEIIADSTPLRQLVGWQPEIDFDMTLRDTLDFWRGNELLLNEED
jgi:GDP-4-dehydro-6-deoxy-D-mannose reductase